MKFSLKKLLIVLLYVGGITLLIFSFITFHTHEPEEKSGYATTEKIDLDLLVNNPNFKSETTLPSFESEFLAFFVINVTDCAPCIKEV